VSPPHPDVEMGKPEAAKSAPIGSPTKSGKALRKRKRMAGSIDRNRARAVAAAALRQRLAQRES